MRMFNAIKLLKELGVERFKIEDNLIKANRSNIKLITNELEKNYFIEVCYCFGIYSGIKILGKKNIQ